MDLNHLQPTKAKATMTRNIPALQPELQVLRESLDDGIQWQTEESAHGTIQETGLVAAADLDVDTHPITTMAVAATGPGTLQSGLEIATSRNGVATETSERNAATDLAVAAAVDRLSTIGIGIGSAAGNAVRARTRTEFGIGRGLGLAIEITTVIDAIAAGREVASGIETVIATNTGRAVADIHVLHHGVPPHVLDALGLGHGLVIVAEIAHALDHGQSSVADVHVLVRLCGKGLDLVIDREKDDLRLAHSTSTAMYRPPAIGVNHRGVEYGPRKETPGHHGSARQTAICPPLKPNKARTGK